MNMKSSKSTKLMKHAKGTKATATATRPSTASRRTPPRASKSSERSTINTPFGPLVAWHDDDGTLHVEWGERTSPRTARSAPERKLIDRLARAATGRDADFDDVPTPAGTAFQRKCWTICRRIPRGRTLTYGEVAKLAGAPGAARAVGQAMRRNPIPLIVPCHRVVATNGLGGYAGTDRTSDARCRRKAGLLELERSR